MSVFLGFYIRVVVLVLIKIQITLRELLHIKCKYELTADSVNLFKLLLFV